MDIGRRRALKLLGGGVTALAGFKALDNVVLGYGVLVGTNLHDQDLASVAGDTFGPQAESFALGDARVRLGEEELTVSSEAGESTLGRTDVERARAVDAEHGLDGALVEFVHDAAAIDAGDVRFEFSTVEAFFERCRDAESRPGVVEASRGPWFRETPVETVERFTEADAADPETLVHGLTAGFRQYADYDVERYLAGSVEDNVLFGAADLRSSFADPVAFDALLANGETGMFCYEFVFRSIEAFHARPAREQSVPVVAGYVRDARHKHAYTVLASVVREDGDLVVPATFVDYTHTTLYDDLYVRGVMGEGLEAYNTRHRATEIRWY